MSYRMSVALLGCLFVGCKSTSPAENQNNLSSLNMERVDAPYEKFFKMEVPEIKKTCKIVMEEIDKVVKDIKNTPLEKRTFENTIKKFEEDTSPWVNEFYSLSFMGSVSSSPEVQDEARSCGRDISEYFTNLLLDEDLYNVLKDQKASHPLDELLLKDTLQGFEENGLKLSPENKKRFQEINKKLVELAQNFGKNLQQNVPVLEFKEEELKGIPENTIKRFELKDSIYAVKLISPNYSDIMRYAQSDEMRKKTRLAYQTRVSEVNTPLLQEAITLRHELAKLLGYENWAKKVLSSKRMVKSPEEVVAFLEDLRLKVKDGIQKDRDVLRKEKGEKVLNSWELGFISEKVKQKEYNIDSQEIKKYFPSEKVVEGAMEIFSKLNGIAFEYQKEAPVWHESVKAYKIFDATTKQHLAWIYLDLYPRENKYSHAAAFSFSQGFQKGNQYVRPASAMVTNFTPPTSQIPSLMSHGEVETFFHEFGHLMHQTLTQAPYISYSGTSVPRDFVEVPSQMMEHWVWNKEILKKISSHYETKEPLSDELILKMQKVRNFQKSTNVATQILFAHFDMQLYSEKINPQNLVETYYKQYKEAGFDEVLLEGENFPSTFDHIMSGYSAGYYSYLWSEVLSDDAFSLFEQKGLLNEELGMKYRKTILTQGGTLDPYAMMENFLGRKPTHEAFIKNLRGPL